jgi:hypothetical protein
MTTAVLGSREREGGPAGRSLDTLVVGNFSARGMGTVVLEQALPFGSAPLLHEDVGPTRRPGRLGARWAPGPRGERGLVCIWGPPTRMGASDSEPRCLIPGQVSTKRWPR